MNDIRLYQIVSHFSKCCYTCTNVHVSSYFYHVLLQEGPRLHLGLSPSDKSHTFFQAILFCIKAHLPIWLVPNFKGPWAILWQNMVMYIFKCGVKICIHVVCNIRNTDAPKCITIIILRSQVTGEPVPYQYWQYLLLYMWPEFTTVL